MNPPTPVLRRAAQSAVSAQKAVAELLIWTWIPDQLRDHLARATRRAWQWAWAARWRRVAIRATVLWHAVGSLLLVATAPARADYSSGVKENPVFSWMELKDSHGISVWKYFMSIDEGSARNVGAKFWSPIIKFEYEIYRVMAASAIWVMRFALEFEWLQWLVSPVRTLGDALTNITSQAHLSPVLLTLAGAIGSLWILRGRWATGIYEILMACTIAVVAVGVLSNPIERVAGTDGLIMEARDAGLQLGAGLANKGDTESSPDQLIDEITQTLADSLIRQPTQLLNFGRVIDAMPPGHRCIEAWDRGHDDYPGNTKDTLKDNIRNCEGGGDDIWESNGGEMKDWADNPGVVQAISGLVLILGGAIMMIFGVVLAAGMIMAAVTALAQALKSIITLLFGVVSGMARDALWRNIAHLAIALLIQVFAICFVVGYMIVLQTFFASSGDNLFKKFCMVDVVMLLGIWQFRRGIKGLRGLADGLAAKLGTRPGPSPSSLSPARGEASPLRSAYYAANVATQAVAAGGKAVHMSKAVGAKGWAVGVAGKNIAGTVGTGGLAAAVMVGSGVLKAAKAATRKSGDSSEPQAPAPKPAGTPAADKGTAGLKPHGGLEAALALLQDGDQKRNGIVDVVAAAVPPGSVARAAATISAPGSASPYRLISAGTSSGQAISLYLPEKTSNRRQLVATLDDSGVINSTASTATTSATNQQAADSTPAHPAAASTAGPN